MPRQAALPSGTVTFLFTDIEGSTKLLKRLGRVQYQEALETHNGLIRAAISRHHGAEVDRQGDAFFAAFETAGEAVAAAVDAQQALSSEEWPGGEKVAVRMGIHTGEATVTDDGYVGLAVHHASRVAGAAVGGQVLLSATAARLIAIEPSEGIALLDLGERVLPDLDHPEQLFAIATDGVDAPTATRAPPAAQSPAALLDRASELAAFEALIDATRAGHGRLVVIEGTAGIGKTALLTQARHLAEAAGFDVVSARAGELETAYAFGIVRQLLEPVVASAGDEERAALMAGAARLATPVLAQVSETAVAEQDSFTTLHGLYWLTANLAARAPLLVLVDDLHWADAASLEWLVFLSRRLEGLPLLLLCASRSAHEASSPSLVTELLADPLASLIRPAPLSAPAASALAFQRLQQVPDDEFTTGLVDATDGNPLYLSALLDAVATAGIAPTTDHKEELNDLAPEALARGIALRLSRLRDEAASLVRASAVLGESAPLTLAGSLAGLDQESALSSAALLVREDLLASADPPVFRHPVVRSAVYSSIDAGERSTLHKRAAGALLAAGAAAEQAAGHLVHVVPDGDPDVVDALRRAARSARSRGAPDAAITYLRRALAEPSGDQTATVLRELGSAEYLIGRSEMLDSLGAALELTEDPAKRAGVALGYSRALWLCGRYDTAIQVLQEAVDNPGVIDAALHEELEAGLIGVSWGHSSLYPIAVERLSGINENELVGGIGTERLLAHLAELDRRSGVDRERAIELAERSLASGNVVRDRDFAMYSAVLTLITAGELERAGQVIERALTEARQRGDIVSTCRLTNAHSHVHQCRGDLRAAEQDIAEALELSALLEVRIGISRHSWITHGRQAWVALERGNTGPAHELLAALDPADIEDDTANLIFLLEIRGKLHTLERKPESALADYLAAGTAVQSIGFENPAELVWRSQAALALLELGRPDEALVLAAEEAELARRWGAPGTLGTSLHALGLVEGGEAGEEHLREALAILVDSPNRLEHARVLVDLGAALRRANSRSEARKHLREALELAEWCGATSLFDRANDELAATGAHRRTVMLRGIDALTASEQRVAKMAAAGASNKEIAQGLFVTVKTVEMHLSRVYRKLELSSRAQLAGALSHQQEPTPTTA
jgi:class 3 adenylate cyclase/DNA-binding CsgD family transcriptional regulator/tetratricopeptide (TPR) repeat protein